MITTLNVREGFELFSIINKNEESYDESLKKVLSEKDYIRMIPIIEFLRNNEKITPVEAEKNIKKISFY